MSEQIYVCFPILRNPARRMHYQQINNPRTTGRIGAKVNGVPSCYKFPPTVAFNKTVIVNQLLESSPSGWNHVEFARWVEDISSTSLHHPCGSFFSEQCIDFACFLELKETDMLALGITLGDAQILISIQQSYLAELHGISSNASDKVLRMLKPAVAAQECNSAASLSSFKPRTYGQLLILGYLVLNCFQCTSCCCDHNIFTDRLLKEAVNLVSIRPNSP